MCVHVSVCMCVQNVAVYLDPKQLFLMHNDKRDYSNNLCVKYNGIRSFPFSHGAKSYLFCFCFFSVPIIRFTNHINTVDVKS